MKRIILLYIASFFWLNGSAQVTFQKVFGGTNIDYGSNVFQTIDGGYIITGSSGLGAGGWDIYMLKTDVNGDTLWTKTYGGIGNDFGNAVVQTIDGGYLLGGATTSFGVGSSDMLLLKTDSNGNILWTKTFGGVNSEEGFSAQQTADSGYVLSGIMNANAGDFGLIKTDIQGNLLWAKAYGGSSTEESYSVKQTTDGGYIMAGYTLSFGVGSYDVWLVKTDVNGDTLWSKTLGGPNIDEATAVQQTVDGGYIITGWTNSFGAGDNDAFLFKTDANGNLSWAKTFGGIYSDQGSSVLQATDGGYVITGFIRIDTIQADGYLIKTDGNGNLLWAKAFGGTNSDNTAGIIQSTDGGYVLTGQTWSFGAGSADVYLIKTDSAGYSGCNENNLTTSVTSPTVMVTSPAYTVSTGITSNNASMITGSGAFVGTLCIANNVESNIPILPVTIFLSPNPATSELRIQNEELKIKEIKIYNVLGEEVYSQQQTTNNKQQTVEVTQLPSGIYFVRAKGEKGESVAKFVKE